ncbi:MAG: hypothetical protein K6T65_13155 [Peptococcaceae bacterium]|nr:hypothetical protein [Peptococcaceae bacterium]
MAVVSRIVFSSAVLLFELSTVADIPFSASKLLNQNYRSKGCKHTHHK